MAGSASDAALETSDEPIFAACGSCPTTLDPKCTIGNQNALNECYATQCLGEAVSHEGFCSDSPECVAQGGTCEERALNQAWCPDGSRWDKFDPELACPGGNLRNTCCKPWNAACSFVSISQTLDLDPFTCQKPPTGNPWTCIHPKDQQGCIADVVLEQPPDVMYAGSFELTASFGSQLTLEGSDAANGRSFTCTGKISYDMSSQQAWNCSACVGSSCTSCIVHASADCQF
jgi:hypothetical protein